MGTSVLKMVVMIIGTIMVIVACGMVYLVTQDKSIPGTFETIMISGFTGLLGLLAPSRAAAAE